MTQFTCKGVKQINNWISLNMTFTFTIRISWRFSSAREFQMGNFQKYWLQYVGQDFFVLDFFHRRKILKVVGRDRRYPQNREKTAPAGRFTCIRHFEMNNFFPKNITDWNFLPPNRLISSVKLYVIFHVFCRRPPAKWYQYLYSLKGVENSYVKIHSINFYTVRTEVFSTKSPWSVFFLRKMSVKSR